MKRAQDRMLRNAVCHALAALAFCVTPGYADEDPPAVASDFASRVDLSPMAGIAVQDTGRLKSFETFARKVVRDIAGPRGAPGQEASFTYLDLMFRPEEYREASIIYVKKKQVRAAIAQALYEDDSVQSAVLKRFKETGQISAALLMHPAVVNLLDKLDRDLMRTAKSVNEIRSAMQLADPRTLSFILRVIPLPDGEPRDEWLSVDQLGRSSGVPQDAAHAGVSAAPIPGLEPERNDALVDAWRDLGGAWRAQSAPDASEALARVAGLLQGVNPALYPDAGRLSWESWYFRSRNMTWIWGIYLLALVPLLMSVIYRWDRARFIGMGLFVVAFGFHTAALLLRWYISGRWPNSNMFEAVTTTAWFCGAGSFVLEYLVRKTALRNLFFLGSAVASMAALMAAYYMPVQLNPHIGNMMPVLHDVWLYIHTNVIIYSYGLIAMAAVSALLYLGYRMLGGNSRVAKAGGAGSLIMSDKGAGSFLKEKSKATAGQVLDAATMVSMELSFILLWTGLVMGAIWADHSWGRPWGWDPKEVFALNTFIIFLLLVHVRFKVRDKGFWTAILAVVGCCVMLFNWIVVNFVITGLHSYA